MLKRTVILTALVLAMSCEETNLPLECGTDLICTEQFEVFTYSPMSSTNEVIRLDSFYSINLDNGKRYDFTEYADGPFENNYVVITDAEVNEVNKEGTIIRFFGVVNSQVTLEQDFKIGHDCCHIVGLEGPGIDSDN